MAIDNSRNKIKTQITAIHDAEEEGSVTNEMVADLLEDIVEYVDKKESAGGNGNGNNNGNCDCDPSESTPTPSLPDIKRGEPNGVAPLDEKGLVPPGFIPEGFKDYLEFEGMYDGRFAPTIRKDYPSEATGRVIFCAQLKSFVYELEEQYYAGWPGDEYWGARTANGVPATAGRLYLDRSTDTLYRSTGEALIPCGGGEAAELPTLMVTNGEEDPQGYDLSQIKILNIVAMDPVQIIPVEGLAEGELKFATLAIGLKKGALGGDSGSAEAGRQYFEIAGMLDPETDVDVIQESASGNVDVYYSQKNRRFVAKATGWGAAAGYYINWPGATDWGEADATGRIPRQGCLYCDLSTGAFYRWTGADMEELCRPGEAPTEIVSADGIGELKAECGKFYRYDSPTDILKVTLPTLTEKDKYVGSFGIYVETGSNPQVSFEGAQVMYYNGFSIMANTKYELNVMHNGKWWTVAWAEIQS